MKTEKVKRPKPEPARWISVEERLPENGEWAIVVIDGYVQRMAARFSKDNNPACSLWDWFDEDADPAPVKIVSYWMLWPDPPKEKS